MDGFDRGGFAAGSVTGYRWWTLAGPPETWLLRPEIRGPALLRGAYDFWQPGVNEARCLSAYIGVSGVYSRYRWYQETHDVPEISCGCGFWAYWKPSPATALSRVNGETAFFGMIEGWGRVLIGEHGFRAQKARIIALHPQFTLDQDFGGVLYFTTPWGYFEPARVRTVSETEMLKAAIEDRVDTTYPEVRMYATRNALLANHPPDKNYGGGDAP